MWPPNLLPPIGFLSLATYISNYSDGRKEGIKKFKGKREGEERKVRERGRKGERKEGKKERKRREEVKEGGRGYRRDRKRGRT